MHLADLEALGAILVIDRGANVWLVIARARPGQIHRYDMSALFSQWHCTASIVSTLRHCYICQNGSKGHESLTVLYGNKLVICF